MVTIVRPLESTGFRGEVGVEEHMASRGRLCADHFGCYGVSKEIQRLVVRLCSHDARTTSRPLGDMDAVPIPSLTRMRKS